MCNSLVQLTLLLSIILAISACSRGDSDPVIENTEVATSVPNEFASFVNKQHSLSASDYTAVIATNSSGQSGSYTLKITFDDGHSETRTGSINTSNGPGNSCAGLQRPCESINLDYPGGIELSLSATVPSQVSLVDRAGNLIHTAAGRITIPTSKVDGEDYSKAYYRAIDPADERTNLAKWKTKNGFNSGSGTTVSATFRDVNDLGYGRHITAHRNTDGSMAFMVDNYLVDLATGDSSANYGSLNLDAAVLRARKFHDGTNAIEFSPVKEGGDIKDSIVKFYTFLPGSTDEEQLRRNVIDMDGRGLKSVPSVCLSCHGGRVLPLNNDGSFNSLALGSAELNLLNAESFEYSSDSGFSKGELHDAIRMINDFISRSYTTDATEGSWDASYAFEVSQGRYSGSTTSGRSTSSFIPEGWRDNTPWVQDPAKKNPTGTALLFKQVVEPHCYSCHALQGSTQQGINNFISTAVNFSSYEKFKTFEEQIVEYVYRRGNMPLSLRNFERFWLDPAGAPSLLASHLGDSYDIQDKQGNRVVRVPGMPFAKAGEDRVVASPVSLNASASLLSNTFKWKLLSAPSGATHSFTAENANATQFSANLDGVYTLQLSTSNDIGSSVDTVRITIDSGLTTNQKSLRFDTDIRAILGSDSNTGKCTLCHSEGGTPVTPVFYTDAGRSTPNSSSLYTDVMARVNLMDPENSLILQKPLGNNHVGGTIAGFSNTADTDYQTLLNWIREGALQ